MLFPLSGVAQEWENDFNTFDSLDKAYPPPKNPIVFTGSSSIRFWIDVAQDLQNEKIINRGFGGSEFSDLVENYDRVIKKYNPDKLFIYSGDNDIANGKSAIQTFGDFCTLYGMIKSSLPDTEIFVLSIKPSPSRWDFAEEMVKANSMIKVFCHSKTDISYIDVWNPMISEKDQPESDLFIGDSLHMNANGYKLWTEIVSQSLK